MLMIEMLFKIVLLSVLWSGLGSFELYTPKSAMCCRGKVIVRDQNDFSLCCGNSVFDTRHEMCCGEKVFKVPEDESSFLSRTSSKAFPKRSKHHGCCGDSIFNFKNQLCCNGKLVKIPVDEVGNPFTFFSCCGSKIYNISDEDCCRDKILPKSKRSEGCCGDQIIDYSENLCCPDDFTSLSEIPQVHPLEHPDESCCGRKKIHLKTEICCKNKIIQVTGNLEQRSRAACCGDRLWLVDASEMCCDGKVLARKSMHENCCGTSAYDTTTQICCDGHILALRGNQTYCCGTKAYDANEETCCYGSRKIVQLKNEASTTCCE